MNSFLKTRGAEILQRLCFRQRARWHSENQLHQQGVTDAVGNILDFGVLD